MEVLSPKSANLPINQPSEMKKHQQESVPKANDKPVNPDRIDDKWRPPVSVTEPGDSPETYLTGKKLGKGGFAVCFEGRTKATAEIFALKVVKAQVQQKKMMEKFRTEMQIHAKMQHPNIVAFHKAFTLDGHTYVVLEMCSNGSLTDMVKARGCLSLPEVRRYMIQICGGVKYMHQRSVIHRDLKMGNIFIDSRMNLQIGDFGLAAVMADEHDRRTTLCGTPNYIAPEILSKSGTRGHDYKVDTWALGVIAYAMLTGSPPFQSKTQQEIYSKLKGLEYNWKKDGANYIPYQAEDLVASCLNLNAAERPDMDDLVEQDFFKMGVIAGELDSSCLKSSPGWLLTTDPRGDRVKPGVGVHHDAICSQCGVGKLKDGTSRPVVGGKARISALVEIELENRLGTAPTTPLPEGILYKQPADEHQVLSSTLRKPLTERPRSRKPVETTIRSTAVTDQSSAAVLSHVKVGQMPPPARPVQSFAAQQRQQALPRTASGRANSSRKEIQPNEGQSTDEDRTSESHGLLKARPVRAASVRSTRSKTTAISERPPKSISTNTKIDELSDRLTQEMDEMDSKTSGYVQARNRAPDAVSLPARSQTLRQRKDASNRIASTTSKARAESTVSILKPVSGNAKDLRSFDRKGLVQIDEIENFESMPEKDVELPKHCSSFKPRVIGASEPYRLVPDSSHAMVIKSLRSIYHTLGQASTQTPDARLLETKSKPSLPYPRVDKWVDYATKHGIAYILTDGSLGMILKSRETEAVSSSCIIIRDAQTHTLRRASGVEQQLVPQGTNIASVEFYEQVDAAFAMKRLDVASAEFRLDMSNHKDQSHAAQALLKKLRGTAAHRMKDIGLLDKFGRYMNKQMGCADLLEAEPAPATRTSFIHFYQRMGNVGVWRFIDGGLQFNFPDHTKLILYRADPLKADSDLMIDVVCLDPTDAKELSARGVLTNDGLERRTLRTFAFKDIHDGNLRRQDVDITRSNEIREKISWIRAVLGCWIKEGGLGRTGDDSKLGWSGMQEQRTDKKVKLQWVTVGRLGGDDDALALNT